MDLSHGLFHWILTTSPEARPIIFPIGWMQKSGWTGQIACPRSQSQEIAGTESAWSDIRFSFLNDSFRLKRTPESYCNRVASGIWKTDMPSLSSLCPRSCLAIYLISSQNLNSCEVFILLSPGSGYTNNTNVLPFDFIFGWRGFVVSLFQLSLYFMFPEQQNDPFQDHSLYDADTSCSM